MNDALEQAKLLQDTTLVAESIPADVAPAPDSPAATTIFGSKALHRTLAAFTYRDFRVQWFGACTSSIGTWVQITAQNWMVLSLTNSAFFLGLDSFLQQLPIMLFTLVGGLRTGLALAVIGVIVGEILGSKAGMGTLINHAYGLFRTSDYVALVCVTLVLVVGSDAVASLFERRARRWTE